MNSNDNFRKILIVSPNRLGDTVFCTPVFRLFKKMFPASELHVVALSILSADVLERNPYIDKIFPSPLLEEINKIASEYDLAVNMHDSVQAQEILAVFPCRVLTYHTDIYQNMHQTDKLLKFFAETFDYDLSNFDCKYDMYPKELDADVIQERLTMGGYDPQNEFLIGYHMGCYGLSKTRTRILRRMSHRKAWPLKQFLELTRRLQARYSNLRVVLTGIRNEASLGEMFCQSFPETINLIDKTSVSELTALMRYLKLFVSNDTGTLHVACTGNMPVIALFGKENFVANGPYPKKPNRIVMYKPNIVELSAADVCQVACQLLG